MVSARKGVVYLAGDADACKKLERVVAGFADSCLYFGEFGAASRVKLVNNLLVAINIAATAEAMALGLKAGVDVPTDDQGDRRAAAAARRSSASARRGWRSAGSSRCRARSRACSTISI